MSNPAALGAIEYEAEATFGEDVTTFATHRLPVLGAVDLSGFQWEKLPPDRVVQYRNDGTQWVLGTQGGSFKTKLYLHGHGATMVGSPTVDAIETFLAYVFGGNSNAADISAAASTTLTGGTAAVPLTTASGTFDAGGLCRIGSLGDGRGGGQFYGITTHTGTSLTLVGALPNAPNNLDVLYPVVQLYEPEDPTTTAVTGLRFRLLTANLRMEAHGCWPMSVVFAGLSPGEIPTIEITWGVSWWRYTTATFPSTVSSNVYQPAPIAGGSLNMNTVGVTTRSTRAFRNLQLEHVLDIEPIPGPGGANAYQKYVGARRKPSKIRATWTEDADAATVSPALHALAIGTNFQHIEYSGSVSDGSAFGWRMPKACITTVPLEKNDNGLNRLTVTAEAYTSTVTTNDRTLAAIIYGMA